MGLFSRRTAKRNGRRNAERSAGRERSVSINPYQKRLILLMLVMFSATGILAARTGWLSIARGDSNLSRAMQVLRPTELLPTYRGRILDAKGRILAEDTPGWAIEVDYSYITESAVNDRNAAVSRIRRTLSRAEWGALSDTEQAAAIDEELADFERVRRDFFAQLERWGQTSEDEIAARLDQIRARVMKVASATWANQEERARERALADGNDPSAVVFTPEPIREQVANHVVLEDLDDESAFTARVWIEKHNLSSYAEVVTARRRHRPWRNAEVSVSGETFITPLHFSGTKNITVYGVDDGFIGSMRPVYAEDITRRPFRGPDDSIDLGGYRPRDDRTGKRGIEYAAEDVLRGTRGRIERVIESGAEDRLLPVPGDDLRSTIDIELQARLLALLNPSLGMTRVQPWHENALVMSSRGGDPSLMGMPLDAAIAVIEVESGFVRGLVSTPTSGQVRHESADGAAPSPWPGRPAFLERSAGGKARRAINRASEWVYPPGSIVKPLVLCAAAAEGVYDLREQIECNGHFFPNTRNVARCWCYRAEHGFTTHGPMAADDAIAQSCNIFFNTLAGRLGAPRIQQWFRDFGVGSNQNVGFEHVVSVVGNDGGVTPVTVGVSPGLVVDPDLIMSAPDRRYRTVMLGIGQNGIAWSPLHAAAAYATLGRGMVHVSPTIIDPEQRAVPQSRTFLDVPRGAVDSALSGLRKGVTHGRGTASGIRVPTPGNPDALTKEPLFDIPGVTVWAKTGSAQEAVDRDGDGTHESILVHGWVVGLVGPKGDAPTHAFSVLVEWGGSGSRSAGPIAAQVIRALQATGELPGQEPGSFESTIPVTRAPQTTASR